MSDSYVHESARMGKIVLRQRDLNRFKKVYPYVRAAPRYVYMTDTSFNMETAVLDFNGLDEITYTFVNTYSVAPTVIATALNESINVFVKSLTTTQVTIGASASNQYAVSIVVVAT